MYQNSLLNSNYGAGRIDGIKEGIEKGRKEGIEKGEKQAKIEIAKKSLLKGLDIETIVELTGLNMKKIEELKSKN